MNDIYRVSEWGNDGAKPVKPLAWWRRWAIRGLRWIARNCSRLAARLDTERYLVFRYGDSKQAG